MPLPIKAIEAPDLASPIPGTGMPDAETTIFAKLVTSTIVSLLESKPDPWRGSEFRPLRSLTQKQKSKASQSLLVQWFGQEGITVTAKIINGNTTLILPGDQVAVVKFSTLWAEQNIYRFQQFRDWDYQFAILLGISPQAVHLWIVPREEILTRSVPQHASESRMLTISTDNFPVWLGKYGGTLAQATYILKEALSEAA